MKAYRSTKIICTIGPASANRETLVKMINAGMDVARLNFSHGSHENHKKILELIRSASKEAGRQVGILLDLSGPKIRLGELNQAVLKLNHGQNVVLQAGDKAEDGIIPVQYAHIAEDLSPGARILLADGLVELRVDKIELGRLYCTVLNEGEISSHKGLNLPLTKLRIPSFTDKDRRDLEFGLNEGIDFVAMSFVRSVEDLVPIMEILTKMDHPPLLLAKVEKPEAIDKLDEILAFVDGLMVARGDLGVEMPFEELPIMQKKIIAAARRAAKPVITATQMLRSMIDNPRPTRAEATDTANAILDGTGAVMLSEETAIGSYPVEAVRTLHQIAKATEPHINSKLLLKEPDSAALSLIGSSITKAACYLARKLSATCIVVTSKSGKTARKVARFRPQATIVGITSEEKTYRQMSLFWGVAPLLEKEKKKPTELADLALEFIVENKLGKSGDRVILTSGYPSLQSGTTDMLKVLTIP